MLYEVITGIFIGATRTAEMRNAMIASLVFYLAAIHWLMPIWGNHGLWAAFTIYMAVRALTLGAYYGRVEAAASASRI